MSSALKPCALREARAQPCSEGELRCARCDLALRWSAGGVLTAGEGGVPDYPEDGNEVFFALEEESFWFRHRNAVLLALVERFGPAGAIWDIGGGNGFQVAALERAGVDAVLVEPGPVGCRNARARGASVVICARLEDVGLPDEHIAAASFLDVLEHLDDPRPLLREAHRALAPGGRVFITVPAYEALWSEADDYAEHKTRYTAPRLRALLEETGYAVDYLGYYFQPLLLPIFLLRSIPSRLRRLRGAAEPQTGADQHADEGLAARAIIALLSRELDAIRAGRELGWGASILAVARKP